MAVAVADESSIFITDDAYEFSAPRFFDFISKETENEKRRSEIWFDPSLSYAPSRTPPSSRLASKSHFLTITLHCLPFGLWLQFELGLFDAFAFGQFCKKRDRASKLFCCVVFFDWELFLFLVRVSTTSSTVEFWSLVDTSRFICGVRKSISLSIPKHLQLCFVGK